MALMPYSPPRVNCRPTLTLPDEKLGLIHSSFTVSRECHGRQPAVAHDVYPSSRVTAARRR